MQFEIVGAIEETETIASGTGVKIRQYLRVIYVPDSIPGSVFVITAYELGENARKALRRRQKKKP